MIILILLGYVHLNLRYALFGLPNVYLIFNSSGRHIKMTVLQWKASRSKLKTKAAVLYICKSSLMFPPFSRHSSTPIDSTKTSKWNAWLIPKVTTITNMFQGGFFACTVDWFQVRRQWLVGYKAVRGAWLGTPPGRSYHHSAACSGGERWEYCRNFSNRFRIDIFYSWSYHLLSIQLRCHFESKTYSITFWLLLFHCFFLVNNWACQSVSLAIWFVYFY